MIPNNLPLPPHSLEAEQAVIGGLLLDNNAMDKIADMLAPADWDRQEHRLIFERLRSLIEQGKPADVVTVAEALQSRDELDKVGPARRT